MISQWGKHEEIRIGTNFEWSFDGQFMIKSNASLTSPFPQLNHVSFELYHNTEWESAQLFEIRGAWILNQLKYTAALKGRTKPPKEYELFNILLRLIYCRRKPRIEQALGGHSSFDDSQSFVCCDWLVFPVQS